MRPRIGADLILGVGGVSQHVVLEISLSLSDGIDLALDADQRIGKAIEFIP